MADVLIVDDNPNNRDLLATILRHAGHTPLEAGTAADALTIAREKSPMLAIVDLSLPDISGAHLIRELRADSRTAGVKIALYTATQSDAALEELRDLYGVTAVIPKPGVPREILPILQKLLEP